MFRIFRTASGPVIALLLGFSSAAHSADYLLDSQTMIAQAALPPGEEGNAAAHDATNPAVAAAPESFSMIVVWSADDSSLAAGTTADDEPIWVADDEQEIFATFISPFNANAMRPRFRISTMGNDDEETPAARALYDAVDPVVAWNPVSEEFLVAWSGDDDTAPLVDDEFEIFAQRLAPNGVLVGDRLRISTMGDDAETSAARRRQFGAAKPAIAVDPETGNYLVAWQGDDDSGQLVDDELEIFGRVLDSKAEPLDGQFRISVSGDDATTDAAARVKFEATKPAAVFNPVSGNFVVAWQADDDRNGMVNGEHEIFTAQVLSDGSVTSTTKVSAMGPDGDAAFDALEPSLAVEPETGAMLVAWHGDTDVAPTVDNEFEIYARLLDAGLVPLGSALRVSSMGPDSESSAAARSALDATNAVVSWSPQAGQFLVAWRGDTTSGNRADNEYEIYGRFLDVGAAPVTSGFRISFLGDEEEADPAEREKYDAAEPVLAESMGAFIAIWSGDADGRTHGDGRQQLFARRMAESSVPLKLEATYSQLQPTAPNPVVIDFAVTNDGSALAENVRLDVTLDNEFPFHWEGCDSTTADGGCLLGSLEGGQSRNVTFILTTDHLEIGDQQSTTAQFSLRSDTAIREASGAFVTAFIPVTISLEGGNGAFGIPLLALLGALPLLARRRRKD